MFNFICIFALRMREFRIIHIDETDSTNRWMKELTQLHPSEETQHEMVVVCDYQTAGRGCGTNSWEAEPGKNLLMSILMHPKKVSARTQFIITQIVSVALCRTLSHYISEPIKIKWPNDIYVGDKKICGVLIENHLQGRRIKDCIIGIGLNVNQTEFKSDAPNPVSIAQLTGKETDREEVLNTLLDYLSKECENKNVHLDYLGRMYRRDGMYPFETEGTRFMARVVGVNDDGRLMLEDENGIAHLFRFKEVVFVI